MVDVDLKRMSRSDLLNIIRQYQTREREQAEKMTELTAKIAELTEQLADKKTHLENAGSIAEAALSLNHIFEMAQTAADQYVAEVQEATNNNAENAKKLLDDAQKEADEIRQRAQAESATTLEKAKEDSNRIYSKVTELLEQVDELRTLLPQQVTAKQE